ncbi:MAG TPA: hypothetical protein VEQ66_04000 [Propionibacteriaceae bacterium]|nr:hypothetical protein [Propionibacteriaceae bacterium]
MAAATAAKACSRRSASAVAGWGSVVCVERRLVVAEGEPRGGVARAEGRKPPEGGGLPGSISGSLAVQPELIPAESPTAAQQTPPSKRLRVTVGDAYPLGRWPWLTQRSYRSRGTMQTTADPRLRRDN